MRKRKVASTETLLAQLDVRVMKGIQPSDPILTKIGGSPERAVALFVREVMESEHASAEDLSTMRFIG